MGLLQVEVRACTRILSIKAQAQAKAQGRAPGSREPPESATFVGRQGEPDQKYQKPVRRLRVRRTHFRKAYPHLVCDYHVQERVTEHRHFAACVPQDRVPFGKVLVIDCGWCACGHQKPVEQAQHNSHRHNSPSSSLAHTQSHD